MRVPANIEHVEARFQQLCCATDGGQLSAELVFCALQSLLPFSSVLYTWLGPRGPVDSYYDSPNMVHHVRLYFDTFFSRSESELWATTQQAAAAEYGPHHVYQVLRVSRAEFHRHPIYNEILRPTGYHTFIRIMSRESGVPVGIMTLGREEGDPDFTDADLHMLGRLEPFLARALALRNHSVGSELCNDQSAMLVVDHNGRIHWQSESAATLLSLARGNFLAPPTLNDGLLRTVRALDSIARGHRSVAVPEWSTHNCWGTFSARPYWLQPQDPRESLIGLVLEHKVPMSVRIDEGLMAVELPLRQMQVCRLLAGGSTENQIATVLGLSHNTVVYHRRQIYCTLGIDSRQELVDLLLARKSASTGAPHSHTRSRQRMGIGWPPSPG